MSTGGSINLQELLDRATRRQPAQKCWATALTGKAAEYVAAIEGVIDSGTEVTLAQVKRDLAEVFGHDLGSSPVRRHFRRERMCRKT